MARPAGFSLSGEVIAYSDLTYDAQSVYQDVFQLFSEAIAVIVESRKE